ATRHAQFQRHIEGRPIHARLSTRDDPGNHDSALSSVGRIDTPCYTTHVTAYQATGDSLDKTTPRKRVNDSHPGGAAVGKLRGGRADPPAGCRAPDRALERPCGQGAAQRPAAAP